MTAARAPGSLIVLLVGACARVHSMNGGAGAPDSGAEPDVGGMTVVVDAGAPPVDRTVPPRADAAAADGDVTGGGVLDAACPRELKVVVRDFRGYASTLGPRHPDFEGSFTTYAGIVQPALGPDQKPSYAPAGATAATTGRAEFDQWYRDVAGVNMRFDDVVLPLTEDPARRGTFVYDDQMFFPIAGRGWMEIAFDAKNYHFTTEIHSRFPYRGGETFTFRGDDDVFVFINGRLAIDLGGVHPAAMQVVDLDARAAELGIARGGTYALDIFQAERHTTESTFRIETTLQCITSYIVP